MNIEALNLDTLSNYTGGNLELVNSTLKVMQESLKEDAMLLKKHVTEKEYLLIKKIAHKIKPNFSLIGLEEVVHRCEEMEKENDHAKLLLAAIEIITVMQELEVIINEILTRNE